ncbi:MAG TPA: DUF5677 domain-containing protein [Myxococcales bacterium]|jgi:hypothetical protein
MTKIGANQKCPCGSGKKYKNCRQHKATPLVIDPFKVKLTNGTAIVNIESAQVVMRTKRDQQIQGWLLERAADAVRDAQMPGAGEFETMKVVLFAAAAAEALANRLLEPILSRKMSEKEWDDYERDTRTADKWLRLYQELGIVPTLQPGHEPLQGLVNVFKLRNDLMHFKHGKNLIITEQWLPASSPDRKHIELDPAIDDLGKRVTVQGSDIRDRLRPDRAADYYGAVRTLLLGALAKHPDDEHNIVRLLKWTTGDGHVAPDVNDILKHRLPHEEHLKSRSLLVVIDLAARAATSQLSEFKERDTLVKILAASMIARLADVLRGVLATCENGLGAEAGALGRIVIEIAITSGYIGAHEERAKHFSAQATVLNQRQREMLRNEHGHKEDENDRTLAEQLRRAREHFGDAMLEKPFPSLRAMAEQAGLIELHDFGYENLLAVSHCDPRSVFAADQSSTLKSMPTALSHTADAAWIALVALSRMVPFTSPEASHHLKQIREVLATLRP